jgi:hypothetical protein
VPTPKQGYHLASGERVPSVTTVIHACQNPDALVNWAWRTGVAGDDYRDVRDEAADIGTRAHAAIEDWVAGKPYQFTCQYADNAFRAFQGWAAQQPDLKIDQTEIRLVSQTGYGGTIDAVGHINGKRVLLDWKTSARVYPSHLIQVAAYRELWTENRPDEPIDEMHIIRLDKKNGTFEHHSWPDLSLARDAFGYMLALYEINAALAGAQRQGKQAAASDVEHAPAE